MSWHEGAFTIGGTESRKPYTAEDLARFKGRLAEAQAHLREVSAEVVTPPPAPLGDPRHRTLPEQLAYLEKSLREHQRQLEEARAAAGACENAIDEAEQAAPEDLAPLEEALSAARVTVAAAEDRVEKSQFSVDRGREQLPEDEQAEAQARIAQTEMMVMFNHHAVDDARADLVPERFWEALTLLAEHATDEWLSRNGPPDPARRNVVRRQILINIKAQLQATMFHPQLRALDDAINITRNPKPRPQGSDSLATASPDPTEPPGNPEHLLNDLLFGTGE